MDKEILLSELKFKAVRSSGAGGQNVNKVSSKVVLSFDLCPECSERLPIVLGAMFVHNPLKDDF